MKTQSPAILSHNELAGATHCRKPTRRRQRKKRNRKNSEQLGFLAREFAVSSEWSKDAMIRLAQLTGLSEAQVYKWGWDQRKKQHFKTSRVVSLSKLFSPLPERKPLEKKTPEFSTEGAGLLESNEVLAPEQLDHRFYCIQTNYRTCMRRSIHDCYYNEL